MTVVVGYTPNEYGQIALEHGIAQAKARNCGIVVVNATRGDAYVDNRFATGRQVEDVENFLSTIGLDYDIRQTLGTDIADQILEVVNEVAANVLVIGIRHRSAIGKMLMGSVAQRLLLDSEVPVYAVKPGQQP